MRRSTETIRALAVAGGGPGSDPLEVPLRSTDVWVVIAFHVGGIAMAWVLRRATAPARPVSDR